MKQKENQAYIFNEEKIRIKHKKRIILSIASNISWLEKSVPMKRNQFGLWRLSE